jgi:hypothetical protein
MNTATSRTRQAPDWLKKEALAIALMTFLALNVFVVVNYGFGGAAPEESSSERLR